MLNSFRTYLRRPEGNISITFAIVAVPLLLAAGSAIDYLRYADARTDIQSSLDGAALAAALPADKTDGQRIAIAKLYFKRNMRDLPGGVPEIDVDVEADTVTASLDTTIPTSFMRLAGIDVMQISERAEVVRPSAGKAELVLVLDYSGSMNRNNKYQNMTAAATTMITNLDAAIDDSKLKIGLVPFSAMVYTSMDKDYVSQASATQTWTGCTQDRAYPHNTNVDTPTGDAATKWGYIDGNGENRSPYDCAAYQNNNLKIIPLSTDLAMVKSKLASMRPVGNTDIPLGAEFGWNLLDPQMPFNEGAPYSDKNNRKFLVLLTDGVQTSGEFGANGSRSVQNGNDNLVTLCTNMRDAGIVVFTIAYDITNPAVTTLLKQCAPDRYYEPDAGGAEINQVFTQISRQIRNQTARISK